MERHRTARESSMISADRTMRELRKGSDLGV